MARHRTRSMLLCIFLFAALFIASPAFAGQNPPPPSKDKPATPIEGSTTVKGVTLIRPASENMAQPATFATVTMSQGFEGNWPAAGWRLLDLSDSDGGEYLWGKRSCHPRTGVYAGWSAGGGAQGSSLDCGEDYPANVDTWAIYGPFNLTGVAVASLNYSYHGYTENEPQCAFDRFFVGASTDDAGYTGVKRCGDLSPEAVNNGYYDATLDLSNYLGQAQVWVAFALTTDDSNHYPGIQIDDISLDVTTGSVQRHIFLPLITKK